MHCVPTNRWNESSKHDSVPIDRPLDRPSLTLFLSPALQLLLAGAGAGYGAGAPSGTGSGGGAVELSLLRAGLKPDDAQRAADALSWESVVDATYVRRNRTSLPDAPPERPSTVAHPRTLSAPQFHSALPLLSSSRCMAWSAMWALSVRAAVHWRSWAPDQGHPPQDPGCNGRRLWRSPGRRLWRRPPLQRSKGLRTPFCSASRQSAANQARTLAGTKGKPGIPTAQHHLRQGLSR